MAALSQVCVQGPATAFPGGQRGAGGNILEAGRMAGEGGRAAGEAGRSCATSYWHTP
jgi:hypothetical protein